MSLSKARGTGQMKVKETITNIDKPKIKKNVSKPKSKLDFGIADDEGVISKSTKSTKKHQKPNLSKLFTSQQILYVMFNLSLR